MARLSGRKGKLYVDMAGGGSASPVAFLSKWSLPRATDKIEVSSFDDSGKAFVAGLPDSQGSYGGWYDDASAQLYTAASDGLPRKFYLYPSVLDTTKYWFGTAFFDQTVESDVGGAISVSGGFAAASDIIKV